MKLLLALLTLVPAHIAHAQRSAYADPSSWVIRLSSDLDVHAVGEISDWQQVEGGRIAESGIPVQATDAFPSFPSVRVEVGYAGANWNYRRYIRYELGAEVGLSSTGGRLYYEDYSGVFKVDRQIRRLLLGVYGEHEIIAVGPALFSGRLHLRASPTTTEYDREVRLGDESIEDVDATFRSVTFGALPALTAEMDVSRNLRVRGHAGYELSIGAGIGQVGRDLPAEAAWAENGPRAVWNGFRGGVGVALRLGGER